jgi:hypothetical protein
MASIRKQGNSYEIRECRSTARGPRQFTLARFEHVLTPEVLDEAAARAHRPFDRRKLVERARERGIAVTEQRRSSAARRLLADLRSGRPLDPSLRGLLRTASRVLRSRGPLRERPPEPFPRFSSGEASAS